MTTRGFALERLMLLAVAALFALTGCGQALNETAVPAGSKEPPDDQTSKRPEQRFEFTSYTEVGVLFEELNYTPEAWQAGIREVPRVYLTTIAPRWRDRVSQEVSVLEKKRIFFRVLAPLVLRSNEFILRDRGRLEEMSEGWNGAEGLGSDDRQWLTELAGAYGVVEDDRIYVDTAQDNSKALEELYQAYLDNDANKYALTPDYAAGFYAFLEQPKFRPPAVKGHVTGPVTWGLTVTDESRRAVIYHEVLGDAVTVLGILAVPDTAEQLVELLADSYHVNREAAFALARVDPNRAAMELVRRLGDPNVNAGRHAAIALGALLDRHPPGRFAPLVARSNLLCGTPVLKACLFLENEYLYSLVWNF